VLGIALLGESASPMRILFLVLLIVAILGLKMSAPEG
jgi:multidrug transporter EmrE-like cation transporter